MAYQFEERGEGMNYIVLEMQTTGGVTATLVNSYSDLNEAKSKYHLILSAAAVSQVEVHAAVILNQTGFEITSEFFEHPPIPEPEEPEEQGEE